MRQQAAANSLFTALISNKEFLDENDPLDFTSCAHRQARDGHETKARLNFTLRIVKPQRPRAAGATTGRTWLLQRQARK